MTFCVTIATNLTDGLLIIYTRIGSAFNKLSENIYFYILTLLVMAVVFDFLRAITEYWFRIKNGISWGTFWFQIGEYERVNPIINNLWPFSYLLQTLCCCLHKFNNSTVLNKKWCKLYWIMIEYWWFQSRSTRKLWILYDWRIIIIVTPFTSYMYSTTSY